MRHFEMFTYSGPSFASKEFVQLARKWDFRHTTSSPLFSQSSSLVENAVNTVKHIFLKSAEIKQDPYIGLLNY